MILTGIDFETTALKDARIVEVGMAMYDWREEEKKAFLIKTEGFLVNPGDVVFEEGAINKHGITPEDAKKYGRLEEAALTEIIAWVSESDYMAAFNGNNFDKGVLESAALRLGFVVPERPWIDPFIDLGYKTDDLMGMCARHGGFLIRDDHRALEDVQAMMRLLFAYKDVNRVLEIASSEPILLKADVSYEDKDSAKNRGYKWNQTFANSPKEWVLSTREIFLQKEIDEAPFGLYIFKNLGGNKWTQELVRPKKSSNAKVVEI